MNAIFLDAHRRAAAAIRDAGVRAPIGLTLALQDGQAVDGGEAVRDRLRLELHLRLEALLRRLVEERLGSTEGQCRSLGQLPGEGGHRPGEFHVGMHPVDQPPLHGLAGGEHTVGVVQLEGPPQTDHAREEIRRGAVRRRGDLRIRHGELRRLRGDHEVTGQGEAHTPARRHPVDGHDHRLGRPGQARDRAVEIRGQLLDHHPDAVGVVVEVLDVAARAEGLARARDDDAAHGAVLVRFEGGVKEIAAQGEVQGVVGFGTVEREGGHAVFDLIADRLVAHTGLL